MLQSQYNLSVQRGAPAPRAAELAKRYFLRAQALDLTLDRQKILPQLPAQTAQAEPARIEPPPRIRRLSVASFPQLPPSVAQVLRARQCEILQPTGSNAPGNVIRGEFFAKGEPGWAVLCASGDHTSLLAFRSDRDSNPETVVTGGNYDQITAVGRDYIVGHYRAYGGPEPPPIDHQGIDHSILEKASVIWYYYDGKWRKLQGAD